MGKLITVAELKKVLRTYSHNELIELICEIKKIDKSVHEYLTAKFTASDENIQMILEDYKKKIRHEFFPSRGLGRLNLKAAKKAISDFKKICQDKALIVDIMLYYVESGVDFTNEFGDIHDNFYSSLEGVFDQIIKIINNENNDKLFVIFKERLEMIVLDTSNIGWGFHDFLEECYEEVQWLTDENN